MCACVRVCVRGEEQEAGLDQRKEEASASEVVVRLSRKGECVCVCVCMYVCVCVSMCTCVVHTLAQKLKEMTTRQLTERNPEVVPERRRYGRTLLVL